MDELKNLKKRLLYRSNYRGTKEMDILLSSFVKFYINKFNKDQLKELEAFLNLEDEVLYNFYQNNIIVNNSSCTKMLKIFKIFKI